MNNMTTVIDLTTQTMGASNPWQTRNTSQITHIGVHHSATQTGDVFVFENYWKSLGWTNGGYSEIILRDGTVQLCYVPEVVTNGIAGHNLTTYHICCVGSGSFTSEQEVALEARIRFNQERFNIPVARVMGHNEFPGAATECPGRDMNALRQRLEGGGGNEINQVTHTVKAGETLSSIAALYGVTVDAIVQANNIANPNLIHVGQVLIIPLGSTTTQYFPATPTVGNGLVDTLNSIGVDSSFANRQRIASVNGITNYTGTAAQNTQMLSLLNQGRLIRP